MLCIDSLGILAIMGVFAATAQAVTTYDLTSDFSNANNPNGPWAFRQGTTLLQHYMPTPANHPYIGVLTHGVWSTGSNLYDDTPQVYQPTGSGSQTSPVVARDLDFLAGDVVVHSANSGADVLIIWTAPSAGTVDVSGSIWYALSPVTRSNDFLFSLAGAPLDSGSVNMTTNQDRNHRSTFSDTALSVAAGDQLVLDLKKSSGQQYGSADGVTMTVAFTSSIPEPGTWMLVASSLGVLALRRRAA